MNESIDYWFPIKTAPKDNTKILILEKSGRIQVASWRCADGYIYDWFVCLTGSDSDQYPTIDVVGWLPIPSTRIVGDEK